MRNNRLSEFATRALLAGLLARWREAAGLAADDDSGSEGEGFEECNPFSVLDGCEDDEFM